MNALPSCMCTCPGGAGGRGRRDEGFRVGGDEGAEAKGHNCERFAQLNCWIFPGAPPLNALGLHCAPSADHGLPSCPSHTVHNDFLLLTAVLNCWIFPGAPPTSSIQQNPRPLPHIHKVNDTKPRLLHRLLVGQLHSIDPLHGQHSACSEVPIDGGGAHLWQGGSSQGKEQGNWCLLKSIATGKHRQEGSPWSALGVQSSPSALRGGAPGKIQQFKTAVRNRKSL